MDSLQKCFQNADGSNRDGIGFVGADNTTSVPVSSSMASLTSSGMGGSMTAGVTGATSSAAAAAGVGRYAGERGVGVGGWVVLGTVFVSLMAGAGAVL